MAYRQSIIGQMEFEQVSDSISDSQLFWNLVVQMSCPPPATHLPIQSTTP